LALIALAPAIAQDQAQTPAVEQQAAAVDSHHTLSVDGASLAYTATAGTLRVRLPDSTAEAAVFYVSYQQERADAGQRPITFVFNGGPGSSAVWLHLGGLGPRRLVLREDGSVGDPPARLTDNAHTWLRFTDLVFVDPVGTGYSRAIAADDKTATQIGRKFWSITTDLRSLGEFMRLYLTRYDRWRSPKYVAGESYGGFRAAALVDVLGPKAGIELSGAILISPVIEYTLNLGSDYLNVMPWITFVPSYATTAFELGRYRGQGRTLEEVADEAERFSRTELLLALASAASPRSEEVARVFEHFAAITGLETAEVQRHRGRIRAEAFAKLLLEDRNRVLGIYDGSISMPDPTPSSGSYPSHDPSFDPLVAPVVSTLNAYLRDELGYRTDERYDVTSADVLASWDWAEAGLGDLPGVGQRLRSGLSVNPKLKVLVAHGYFDLATPYFASKYIVQRLELDENVYPNLQLAVYPGGLMFYTRTDARQRFFEHAKARYEAPSSTPGR
jgi:carboxypeptidase C (cathepsin A)